MIYRQQQPSWSRLFDSVTTKMPDIDVKSVDWVWIVLVLYSPVVLYHYYKLGRYLYQRFRRGGGSESIPLLPESKTNSPKQYLFKGKRFESVKIGSDPFTASWPRCQVIIWNKDDKGQYYRSANAWRYANYLVTASHCLEDNLLALSVPDQDIAVVEYTKIYDHDEIAILKIPVQFFSEYNVKSATITDNLDGMVRVTGCGVKQSTTAGILSPTEIFGMFKYSGTTKEGFSGAPYMVGDTQVVAMHLFGGDAGNLCVQASYIKMLVHRIEMASKNVNKDSYKKAGIPLAESSNVTSRLLEEKKKKRNTVDDWYIEEIQPGQKVRVRTSRYDPDEFEFQLGNHYYTVDDDGFRRLRDVARSRGAAVILDRGVDVTVVSESSVNKRGDDCSSENGDSSFLEWEDSWKQLRDLDTVSNELSPQYQEQTKLVSSMQEFNQQLISSMQQTMSTLITHQTSLILESLGKQNSEVLLTMPELAPSSCLKKRL